jgi:hypothetical protein
MIRLQIKFYNKPTYLPLAAKILPDNVVEFTLPYHTDLPKFEQLVSSWDTSGRKPVVQKIIYETES